MKRDGILPIDFAGFVLQALPQRGARGLRRVMMRYNGTTAIPVFGIVAGALEKLVAAA